MVPLPVIHLELPPVGVPYKWSRCMFWENMWPCFWTLCLVQSQNWAYEPTVRTDCCHTSQDSAGPQTSQESMLEASFPVLLISRCLSLHIQTYVIKVQTRCCLSQMQALHPHQRGLSQFSFLLPSSLYLVRLLLPRYYPFSLLNASYCSI